MLISFSRTIHVGSEVYRGQMSTSLSLFTCALSQKQREPECCIVRRLDCKEGGVLVSVKTIYVCPSVYSRYEQFRKKWYILITFAL